MQTEGDITENDLTEIIPPDEIPYASSSFKQQRVPACRPFLSPLCSAAIFFIIGAISLMFALIYLFQCNPINEYSVRYDDTCQTQPTCTVNLQIDKDLEPPVYIYYELSNVYQSNYMYEISKSDSQLSGDPFDSLDKLESCEPVITNDTNNGPESVYIPCGALPMSLFNDTYTFSNGFPAVIDTDISSPNYRKKFKAPDQSYSTALHWMDPTLFPKEQENERFINWVLISAFTTFRKKWGRLNETLKSGTYSVEIDNRYEVESFGGTKTLVVAQVGWMGGRNSFFSIFFFVICGICFVSSILLAVLYFANVFPLYQMLTSIDDQARLQTLL